MIAEEWMKIPVRGSRSTWRRSVLGGQAASREKMSVCGCVDHLVKCVFPIELTLRGKFRGSETLTPAQ